MLSAYVSLSETMADLPDDTCRLVATWMIPHLDRDGRITGSPRRLQAIVVPLLRHLEVEDVKRCVEAICAGDHPLAVLYRDHTGLPVLQFRKFAEYQVGMKYDRESASRFGPPPGQSGTPPESSCIPPEYSASRTGARLSSVRLDSLPLSSPPDPDARETTHGPAALSAALVDLCPRLGPDADRLVPIWLKAYPGLDLVRIATEATAGLSEHGEEIRQPGPFLGKVFKNAFADAQKSSAAAHEAEHKKRKAAEAEEARLAKQLRVPADAKPVQVGQLLAAITKGASRGE